MVWFVHTGAFSQEHTYIDSGTGWTLAHTHGTQRQEWISHSSIMFPPTPIRSFHTHVLHLSPSLLYKVTMSDSIHGHLLSVLVSSLRLNTLLSPSFFVFVLSHFIPMLHGSLVRIFIFFANSSPSSPSGPTKAYRDLFGVCLYPHSLSLAYRQTAECDMSASW